MKKSFKFGVWSMQEDYIKLKKVLQCPHLNKRIRRSTVTSATAWACSKWGRNMDYIPLLKKLGVEIIED